MDKFSDDIKEYLIENYIVDNIIISNPDIIVTEKEIQQLVSDLEKKRYCNNCSKC